MKKLKKGSLDLNASEFALAEKLFECITKKQYSDSVDPAHDENHTIRVLKLAINIARKENANIEIVVAMAILHDIGRANERVTQEPHEIWGAERAKRILEKYTHFSAEKIDLICNGIREHRGSKHVPCTSIESKVLKDADKIDGLGAIGFARTHSYAGTLMQPFYVSNIFETSDDDSQYTVQEEYETKLSMAHTKMETKTGLKMAQDRANRMKEIFSMMQKEINGEI